ncbi:MAG: hypothetical protein J6R23_06145 [Spirochaetales bacterium]|nr:hypothetical protein [Spirochaetales bacterium]
MIKRKFFALTSLITALCLPLFAYTDSFRATTVDPDFIRLITLIRNDESENKVIEAHQVYVSSGITDVERCRAEGLLARFYKDQNNKNEANKHISNMKSLFNSLTNISELEKLVCETELTSADFYVNRNLGVGMDNSNLSKKLYSKYPDEIFSAFTEAWRLIFTPAIAGGSPKKALAILDQLTKEYGDKLTDIDRYTLLCAYAIAYNARGDYKKADSYFTEAFTYFKGEESVLEVYRENLKKLS